MTDWRIENIATLAATTIIVSMMVVRGFGGWSALGFIVLLNLDYELQP